MGDAQHYLDKYKELEDAVRDVYGLEQYDSITNYLSNQTKFGRYRDSLKYCADVRNLLVHRQKLNGRYAVEPSDQMVEFIDSLIAEIRNRKKCWDICIKASDVYSRSPEDGVKKTMSVMLERAFTHVPVLHDDRVIGVFDENSVFRYLASEGIVSIEDDLVLADLEEFLGLDKREMETFLFEPRDMYVDDLKDEFDKPADSGRRVGVVFITQNGKPAEKLLGIITPWDLAVS